MKIKLIKKGVLEISPESVPDELWIEDFVETRRKKANFSPEESTLEIETKDNNGFRNLDPGIPSSNVRNVRLHAEKRKN